MKLDDLTCFDELSPQQQQEQEQLLGCDSSRRKEREREKERDAMSVLFSRARRLFAYGNLDHGSNSNSSTSNSNSAPPGVFNIDDSANMTADSKRMSRRRKLVAAVALLGVTILVIVAMTAKHRANVELKSNSKVGSSNEKLSRSGKNWSRFFDEGDRISLNDVVNGRFSPRNYYKFNGTWVSDDEFLYSDFRQGLVLANLRDPAKTKTVLSRAHLQHYTPWSYSISADGNYLMLQVNAANVFRRSTLSEYVIRPLKNNANKYVEIKLKPADAKTTDSKRPYLIRYASFSPTGNGVVYVDQDNDIYYRRSVLARDERLTDSGIEAEVFNGVPDWVFEEEVFEEARAVWWAPDGMKLVWGTYNDSEVGLVLLKTYGHWRPSSLEKFQYPFIEDVHYPKVGTTNPTVELWMADMSNGTIAKRQIAKPWSFEGEEAHFSRVNFADDEHFAVQWLNRVQNKTVIAFCKTFGTEDCKEIFAQEERDGWIDYKYSVHFDPKWKNRDVRDTESVPDFVTLLSDPHTAERFRQVVLISGGNKERTFLTKENAEVDKILNWSNDGYIYYLSTIPGDPGARHLYRVPGPKISKQTGDMKPECLSCDRQNDNDELHLRDCQNFGASMSQDSSYYALLCKGPDLPYACLCETESNEMLSVYDDNSALQKRIRGKRLPKIEFMEIPVSASGSTAARAQAKLYLPPDFDPNKRYPTLVNVYGGPGFQLVDKTWNFYDYQAYLAGAKGFIYVQLDPAGSGYQGDRWRFQMHKNFGGKEAQSTLEAVEFMQKNLTYVDRERTALWGWSYGGFLTLSVLGQDKNDVFQCGASVAPVVDWTLYDTYYTERYMGLLKENKKGYNDSLVFWGLENIRDKPLLLMHGTHDDNVHFQQSMLLAAELARRDILFKQVAYPDQDHTISHYQKHLYHSLTDFLLNDCFNRGNRLTKK